jgi:hypothetical protein
VKTTRLLSISGLFLFLATGCASHPVTQIKTVPGLRPAGESFHVVVVRFIDPVLYRLSVVVDDQEVRLKSGSFAEFDLPPGTHTISSTHRHILGRYFPQATMTVSGNAGERRYFSYVMKFEMQHNFYDLGMGFYGDMPSPVPYDAGWKEVTPSYFERSFPEAKFNNNPVPE